MSPLKHSAAFDSSFQHTFSVATTHSSTGTLSDVTAKVNPFDKTDLSASKRSRFKIFTIHRFGICHQSLTQHS